jgi:ribokinase
MRVGVVGHVECVEFLRVPQVPSPGDIVQSTESWAEPAGGGAVAAVVLSHLAGEATLFTVLGDDEVGHRAKDELTRLGLRVECAFRAEPQRRAVTLVDDAHERTITLIGGKLRPRIDDPLPWGELAGFDAIYFTAGEPEVVRAARQARILVATARELDYLRPAHVPIDVLVSSGTDPAEHYGGGLEPAPSMIVRTRGSSGGSYDPGDHAWRPATPPGKIVDAYGAGDSFAAGLTFALAKGVSHQEALEVAAQSGAAALTRRGAYGEQR